MLIANQRGGYSFLKGISPYSAGVAASGGYSIEHVRLSSPLPWRAGFERVDQYLRSIGRPRQALCAMALRSPKPFSFAGFNEFNATYVKVLADWEIPVDGVNPIARTNVAPEKDPPSEPCLYSFACTVPAENAPLSFIVSGAGELPEGSLDPHDVVRRGESTREALAEKARFVLGLMDARLKGLGGTWEQVTATNIYTVHDVNAMLDGEILPRIGHAARHGVTWHYTRPPIVSIEYEMDLHGCRRELVVEAR
jgi:hypothetical protein